MNIFTGLAQPKVIYETDSKYNGHIQVVEYGDVRRVVVGGIYQSISHNAISCSRLYWGKVNQILKENFTKLDKVLILGLGGGTLVHLISKSFPGAAITSVDIDAVMVDVARKYFDIDSIPNHKVIVDDAMRVVVEPDKFDISDYEFDAVIVDIYVGERFPDLGRSGNFIGALKKLIKPGGLVIFNRIYRESHQDEVNTFIDYVSNFFSGVKNLVVAGYTNSDNVLIYSKV
jgi:spermidine synthase